MLDAFEARLADLFADRLAGVPELRLPVRTPPAAPPASLIQPVLRVVNVSAAPVLGDDAPRVRRLPGGLGLRTVLELQGVAAVDLVAAVDVARPVRLAALDAVLVALHAEDVRSGAAFADGTDQGFLLRGFRLSDAVAPGEGEGPLRALFAFAGDFWPVRPDDSGPAIATIPTRLASLPVTVPAGLSVRAGGPDLVIPLTLDLRSLGAAPARVVARLRGAAPPGSLIGDAAPLPGFTAYPVDADGVARLVFRPAAMVAAMAIAGIEVSLAGVVQPSVALAEISVRVLP